MPTGGRIILTAGGDLWGAEDRATRVTSKDRTREAALENLVEAIDGFHGLGVSPSAEELHDADIDHKHDAPEFLDDSEIFD